MHCGVLRQLADVGAKPLSIIFKRSRQSGEVPGDWKKGTIVPIFKKYGKGGPWELSTCQPHLCAWQDHGTDPPKRYAKAHRGQEVIRDSQHGFTKGKSCLTNLMVF